MPATLTIGGRGISADTVSDVSVQIGRDNVDNQPDGSVLTATVEGWQPVGEVGQPTVLVDIVGQLFTGRITDVDSTPSEDYTFWRTRLVAVGPLADLGRAVVGDAPWPQETDSQRVYRILQLAAAPHAADSGLPGPQILARDVDKQTAADLCRSVASDAWGVLWEQPSDPIKPIRYSPQILRRWNPVPIMWGSVNPATTWAMIPATMTWDQATSANLPMPGAPGAFSLDDSETVADVVFSQRLGEVVRTVRIVYGIDPGTGDRPEVTAGTGEQPQLRRDTQLADSAGASAVATTIWRSRREPAWRLSSVTVYQQDLTPSRWTQLRSTLAVGMRLSLTLPGTSPAGTLWEGFCEGWEYRIVDDMHSVTLHTSERSMTEPSDQWQDVTPGLTWSAVTAAETWDTADKVA